MIEFAQKENKIFDLFEETYLTYTEIAKEAGISLNTVHRFVHAIFDKESIRVRKAVCYQKSKLSDKNPMYGKRRHEVAHYKGEVGDGYGYLQEVKPDWYTGRKGSKHVFKHHLVMCEALGLTEIPKGFCVHHIDGDKTNNQLNNLALCTVSGHRRIHTV